MPLTDALPSDAQQILSGYDEASSDLSGGLARIWETLTGTFTSYIPENLRLVGTLLLIVLLIALVHSIGFGNGTLLRMTGVVAVVGLCTDALTGSFALGTETLTELHSFSGALLAALAAAMASTGGVTAGTALYAGSAFFLNLLLRLVTELFLPLVYGYLSAAAAGAALGNDTLKRVADLLKWFVTTALKLLSTGFVAYLTLTGLVAGSADGSAVKAVKLAMSTAVPVVGSIIADASETVLVTAGLVKNGVGIFGLLAAIAICAVPFTRIGLRYLALKLCGALAGVVDTQNVVKAIEALTTAMGMVLAMTAVALLLTVFSCVCALRMVSP